MFDAIVEKAKVAAKAVVAAVTPIVTALLVDVLADLSTIAVGLIATGATALTVYLVPNKTT